MTDRELLEAAAKASGIKEFHIGEDGYVWSDDLPDCASGNWNPLLDNSDAFFLAIQLGICIVMADGQAAACRYHSDEQGLTAHEAPVAGKRTGERVREIRRAITKAAAEIWVKENS